MAVIDGVRFLKRKNHAICHIDFFSNGFKSLVRNQLSSVCHGPSKASWQRKAYNYKNTLKGFLDRYDSKSDDIKIGMIGELLTHLLILEYFPEFNAVSPYFNMEEKSVKKGFDIILFSKENSEIWITEVKSGELHKNKNANQTNKVLLGKAKRDLKGRLNENESTLWENAINGALVALEDKRDAKDAVLEILSDISDEVEENKAISTDKNVILVTSLFASFSDQIEEGEIKIYSDRVKKEKLFKELVVFSIQKNTYERVVEFLREEVKL
ncbi:MULTISPECIES: hypothetical protein [Bacillus]|uniref:Anti-bacteriophage protein A/HamA C-terminal domain-containing protein n=1 Tax=Bacillus cereus TaxID=1396 RepID=A0A164KVM6_BACCE|nr:MULTISPECIES: hypothetical protein [Bacillus]KZD51746.1 hypothetical protein B4088_5920 [Bacillus cereus]TSI11204.1 DUF1837 domain-containing protein [Bacillus sp. HY001]